MLGRPGTTVLGQRHLLVSIIGHARAHAVPTDAGMSALWAVVGPSGRRRVTSIVVRNSVH